MDFTNKALAKLMRQAAATYLLKGENRFKIIAYERAADVIDRLNRELKDVWENDQLTEVSGIGPTILGHLDEYFKTPQKSHLLKIIKTIPASVFVLMDIPGIGPKRAFKLTQELKLKNPKTAIDDLKQACLQNRVAELENLGPKSQAEIAQGIALLKKSSKQPTRMPFPYAHSLAEQLVVFLKTNPLVKKVEALVEKLRQEKYEKVLKNLEYVMAIEGKAKFVSQNEVEVNGEKFSAEKFIIAAGSTANVPPIEGIREVGFVTHIEALRLKKQPKELIVIGAGPLGLEFAQMFSRFGTKVTILQRGDSIFTPAEKALTDRLQEVLEKEGITIKTNIEVKSARKDGDKKVVSYQIGPVQEEVSADEILLAAGKTPNTQGLGLDVVGVEINKQQAVIINQYFQTSNPKVFAVGDVTNGPLRLEPTAGREGTLAAENALKGATLSIDYNAVPYTIFTDPQLAGVGFTEDEQMKQMGVCACRTVSFADLPKAIIMRRTEGLIKMAIHPQTKQILGVHILAPNAGEIITEAMILVKNKNTIDDVVNSLPMFPTMNEAIKIVALSFTKDISKLSCCV